MNYKKIISLLLLGVALSSSAMAEENTQKNKPSLLELKEVCQNSNLPSACFLAGGHYFKGEGVTMNIVKAKEYFSKACTLGMKKSCELSINMEKMMNETETKYTTGCAKGVVGDCASLGLIAFRGQLVPKDWVKARKYLTKACDKKDKMSCDMITGLNIVEKYEAECNKGDGKGCVAMGGLYFKGDMDGKPNPDEAMKYLTKACDSGVVDGCSFMARIYLRGMGVRASIEKAVPFIEKACNVGDVGSCMMLGSKYEKGDRVKKDMLKAKELYKKACDLGEKRACEKVKNEKN